MAAPRREGEGSAERPLANAGPKQDRQRTGAVSRWLEAVRGDGSRSAPLAGL